MSFGWLTPEDYQGYSFNRFLHFEHFQIKMMLQSSGWRDEKSEWHRNMGIALNANPAVAWYFTDLCPEFTETIANLKANAPPTINAAEIRTAEIHILSSTEDFTIYTTPEVMDEKCDFIKGWNKERLYELVCVTGKVVLDVGAGSGRLAFAAAERSAWVYASEPVWSLREFMRGKISKQNIHNVRVLDGMANALPFPDNVFDVVMSGHVVGDDYDNEIAELERVCKPDGWIVDCVGDSEREYKPAQALIDRGWEYVHYVGSCGKDVYNHRKRNIK